MRWSEQDLAEHLKRTGVRGTANTADVSKQPFRPQDRMLALGRLKTGEMNKTEAAYDAHLRAITGTVIAWHKFEGVKLRLADNTFYTPDFAVMRTDGLLEMHEVKGFMKDDAAVKLKVAASIYPLRFLLVRARAKKNGGGWDVEEF